MVLSYTKNLLSLALEEQAQGVWHTRQESDPEYYNLLNAARKAEFHPAHVAMLQRCKPVSPLATLLSEFSPASIGAAASPLSMPPSEFGPDLIRDFPQTDMSAVDSYDIPWTGILCPPTKPTSTTVIQSTRYGSSPTFSTTRVEPRRSARSTPVTWLSITPWETKTLATDHLCWISCPGARTMCTENLAPEGGVANGTVMEYVGAQIHPDTTFVAYRTPLPLLRHHHQVGLKSLTIVQFPLVQAWALTGHKSLKGRRCTKSSLCRQVETPCSKPAGCMLSCHGSGADLNKKETSA